MITIHELENAFHALRASTYKGVMGVMRIDGPVPGPVLGITVCTHGNEPAGLAAVHDFLSRPGPHHGLERGTVYLVLNNIAGTEQAFAAISNGKRKDIPGRFIDINMNRLPANTMKSKNDNRYEVRRAQELHSIWKEFHYAIDIHSTSQDAGTMLIDLDDRLPLSLTRGFDIEKLISNITRVQVDVPAIVFYGTEKNPTKSCAIECGEHLSEKSGECAIRCVTALLQNLGMMPGVPVATLTSYQEYFVEQGVMIPDTSYELVEQFTNFGPIKKDTVLARGNGPDIIAPFDGHGLFAGATKFTEKDLPEEVMYLSRPVRERIID